MLSLIGSLIWICVWIYFGAMLFSSVQDDDEAKTAAVVYFTPGVNF